VKSVADAMTKRLRVTGFRVMNQNPPRSLAERHGLRETDLF
jgi:hypothetical protein